MRPDSSNGTASRRPFRLTGFSTKPSFSRRGGTRPRWTTQVPCLDAQLVRGREVVITDAPTLSRLLNAPAVTEHVSHPPPSVTAFAAFVRWAHKQRLAGDGVSFGIVPHGLDHAVGIIQLRTLDATFSVAEWAFVLGAVFWSTGVFVEAANLVADFAFTTLRAHRLEARALSKNGRAHSTLQKLGATRDATLASIFRKAGRRDRWELWSLREEGWRQRPSPTGRLSPDEARRRIAHAIEQTQHVGRSRKRIAVPTRDFPFFITD